MTSRKILSELSVAIGFIVFSLSFFFGGGEGVGEVGKGCFYITSVARVILNLVMHCYATRLP